MGSCSSISESLEQTLVQTSDLFSGEYWVNNDDYYDEQTDGEIYCAADFIYDFDDTNDPDYYYYALTKEDLEYDHTFDESSDYALSYEEYIDLANFVFNVK